ncbi:DUF488 domain-containing protein [Microbacterium terregens]|jgi:uncharacterized protein YeaO (DUF488 family)|uniref:DUF488 domain-containing protein n=1 Tax=Microbacterium terregens TaxID=69363 RepID=A0ABV5T4H7_9MICO
MAAHTIQVRRVYEEPLASDGTRVLVDRLWPRGLSKEKAHLDEWLKDIAPSTELRQWYAHVPERFPEFTKRYAAELEMPDQAPRLQDLRDLAASGAVTLLTATKDADISEAAVLAQILRQKP